MRAGRPGDSGHGSVPPYGWAGSVADEHDRRSPTDAVAGIAGNVGSSGRRIERSRSTAPGRANWAAPRPLTK